jgi:hypothetical protein
MYLGFNLNDCGMPESTIAYEPHITHFGLRVELWFAGLIRKAMPIPRR